MASAFRLKAVGGLCNRLQAILSHRRKHGPLTVVWMPDEYVSHARWGDVFCPLAEVEFVDGGPYDVEDYAPPLGEPDGWRAAYAEVKLRGSIEYMVPRYEHDAIHVRRTDWHRMVQRYHAFEPMQDAAYLAWCDESALPVWVATDNSETQGRFMNALGHRFRGDSLIRPSTEEQAEHDHRRHTTLEQAAVDLFACANAVRFLGSGPLSSFSRTIEDMRRLR